MFIVSILGRVERVCDVVKVMGRTDGNGLQL